MPGLKFEHATGVGLVGRLAEELTCAGDDGVRREHPAAGVTVSDRAGLEVRQGDGPARGIDGGGVRRRFFQRAGFDEEVRVDARQQFTPTRAGGS